MNYRNLGKSELRVSLVGLGCNNFGMRIELEAARKVVHKALDLGITLFDTADIYGSRGGSETMLGQILGERRKEMVLATKFGGAMSDVENERRGSRSYIISAVEASLQRLKTDWIDLYQFHFPDPKTPMEETLRALDDLVRQGKVRHIGISNHAAWQVVDAQWIAKERGLQAFISSQDEYSLLMRGVERELLPALQAFGVGLLPYFPLASGLLTGKYRKYRRPPADTRFAQQLRAYRTATVRRLNWQIAERLEKFCAERNR